jgi:hypothetical protein
VTLAYSRHPSRADFSVSGGLLGREHPPVGEYSAHHVEVAVPAYSARRTRSTSAITASAITTAP